MARPGLLGELLDLGRHVEVALGAEGSTLSQAG
jgi:hypothetical protein